MVCLFLRECFRKENNGIGCVKELSIYKLRASMNTHTCIMCKLLSSNRNDERMTELLHANENVKRENELAVFLLFENKNTVKRKLIMECSGGPAGVLRLLGLPRAREWVHQARRCAIPSHC